jgi:hypothetical protein
LATKLGGYEIFSKDFSHFLREGFLLQTGTPSSMLALCGLILAVVTIELPLSLSTIFFMNKVSGGHHVGAIFQELRPDKHFFRFFVLVFFEELYARWLFLGLLSQIPFLNNTFGFYLLFLIGNGTWALIHLKNYKKEKDRTLDKIMPQFLAGIFFSYVFVKYGFVAAVLTHFASNAILFATAKVQEVTRYNVARIFLSGALVAISYMLMRRPLSDLTPWFASPISFTINGWGFWDFVLASIFIGYSFTLALDLLMYDHTEENTSGIKVSSKDSSFLEIFIVAFLTLSLVVGVFYGLHAIARYFWGPNPFALLLLVIWLNFSKKGRSGSAAVRIFWIGIPMMYLFICFLEAMGFWRSLGYVFIVGFIAALHKDIVQKFRNKPADQNEILREAVQKAVRKVMTEQAQVHRVRNRV